VSHRNFSRSSVTTLIAATLSIILAMPPILQAQRGQGQVPQPARAAAPIDLTGYWVSIVSEDWRLRMRTAQRGDYDYLPLNDEGRRVADSWDPEGALARGEECKAYGAAGIMRIPGRFHISWEDDNTLRIDTDSGTQTRLFRFDESTSGDGPSTPQGYSHAAWRATGGRANGSLPEERASGELNVVTTNITGGHFFRHGIPYSDQAVYKESFITLEDRGVEYLVLTTTLEDTAYLEGPYIRTLQFRKEADDSGWDPTPCLL
jgi:hypothetical protein